MIDILSISSEIALRWIPLYWWECNTLDETRYTAEGHNNAVQYCEILHKLLQELRWNMNQKLDPENTPHTST